MMTNIDDTKTYNKRIGARIKFFRELRNLTQLDLAVPLGYKSSGAFSLIESGERGLNKTKISKAAQLLGTYPEVLTCSVDLTKEQLIDLDKFLHIRTNPQHESYDKLMELLTKST